MRPVKLSRTDHRFGGQDSAAVFAVVDLCEPGDWFFEITGLESEGKGACINVALRRHLLQALANLLTYCNIYTLGAAPPSLSVRKRESFDHVAEIEFAH